MNKTLRFLCVIFILLLLATGCSTTENALTGVFERINAANPLPENYGKADEGDMPLPPRETKKPSGMKNYNSNRGSEETFEEWHNNQY